MEDILGLYSDSLEARAAMEALVLANGDNTLTVLATDPASIPDFNAFCRETGHALLAFSEDQGSYRFVIRKRDDATA
jgi:tRNA 2-thiouridine synthesizing protein A